MGLRQQGANLDADLEQRGQAVICPICPVCHRHGSSLGCDHCRPRVDAVARAVLNAGRKRQGLEPYVGPFDMSAECDYYRVLAVAAIVSDRSAAP